MSAEKTAEKAAYRFIGMLERKFTTKLMNEAEGIIKDAVKENRKETMKKTREWIWENRDELAQLSLFAPGFQEAKFKDLMAELEKHLEEA